MIDWDADTVARKGKGHTVARVIASSQLIPVVLDPRHAKKVHAREPGDLLDDWKR